MKKIIFPFYKKERHHFLNKKWWFRAVIVIYIIASVITLFAIWLWHVNVSSGPCYDSVSRFGFIEQRQSKCSQLARDAWVSGIPIAILGWLIIHYLIQIIFFKVIVDYIVLGRNK